MYKNLYIYLSIPKSKMEKAQKINQIYNILYKSFEPQGWWPIKNNYFSNDFSHPDSEEEILEICIGAILTQSTNWKNAEKSLQELNKYKLIDLKNLRKINTSKLAEIIKSSGYNNQKSMKIKEFVEFLNSKKEITRENLLNIWGVGPETADSILLYAYRQPYFVIDVYTKRIMQRLGFKENKYEELQLLFMNNLEKDFKIYNEFHALLVELGKKYCKNKPLCQNCPLNKICKFGSIGSITNFADSF